MSFEPQLKGPMAVAIIPTRQEDLSEYWDNTCMGGPWLAHWTPGTPCYSYTVPPTPHLHTHTHAQAHTHWHTHARTHGFGRNSKDHIDFTGQSRSSPPWGLWEAESNVGLILEGLVQPRAVCGLLRTIPRPPAGSIHRSRTPLSGTSLWLM